MSRLSILQPDVVSLPPLKYLMQLINVGPHAHSTIWVYSDHSIAIYRHEENSLFSVIALITEKLYLLLG